MNCAALHTNFWTLWALTAITLTGWFVTIIVFRRATARMRRYLEDLRQSMEGATTLIVPMR